MRHLGRDPRYSDADLRARLLYTDAQLLAECRVDTHRVGGPGGQHRNKTESAVRLRHLPSGIEVTGEERRSQHRNKASALDRLREALAVAFRVPPSAPPDWPENARPRNGRLKVSAENPGRHAALAIVLDSLASSNADPAGAADALQISTSSLVKFLADHDPAWIEAQRLRASHSLPPLRRP